MYVSVFVSVLKYSKWTRSLLPLEVCSPDFTIFSISGAPDPRAHWPLLKYVWLCVSLCCWCFLSVEFALSCCRRSQGTNLYNWIQISFVSWGLFISQFRCTQFGISLGLLSLLDVQSARFKLCSLYEHNVCICFHLWNSIVRLKSLKLVFSSLQLMLCSLTNPSFYRHLRPAEALMITDSVWFDWQWLRVQKLLR